MIDPLNNYRPLVDQVSCDLISLNPIQNFNYYDEREEGKFASYGHGLYTRGISGEECRTYLHVANVLRIQDCRFVYKSQISFKNLAMEKVSSPIINNVWRACTVVSLVTAVVLLLYLNQGNRELIQESLKPNDAVSISISPLHVFPSSRNESEMNETLEGPFPDAKNGSLWEATDAEKNGSLEHLSTINMNETLEDSSLPMKDETLDDLFSPVKNVSLEDSWLLVKNENAEDLWLPVKNETSEDSLQQVKNEPLKEENGITTEDNSVTGEAKYCDAFDGSRVHDTTNSPMYNAHSCPFLSNQVDCRRNGRPDFNYES
ncbi:hypothetical protein MLD38_036783 [Melastoma candidum]|uniref:Uncharacterized protein n=1 Tax=Melastoma candidum TaxID=119954 RepID=A0ACB9LKT4_9MYRT|nr:hypothetical protein MLD38_036783 [Melastoma candidum]